MERILFIKLDPKNEADVISWMNSLPPRTINKTVNEIVIAETCGQIARVPYEFSYTNEVEPLRCRLIFRSSSVLGFLAKIPKGEYKTTLVKIIRRHIQHNQELQPDLFTINRAYLYIVAKNLYKSLKRKNSIARAFLTEQISLLSFIRKLLMFSFICRILVINLWTKIREITSFTI